MKDTGKAVADSVVESFNSGKAHAEAGAQEFANASDSSTPGLDRTIGALHMVGVVAAGVDIAATVTPEGKVKEAAVSAVEKLATKAEAAVSKAVARAEGAAAKLESKAASAEARIEGAAPKTGAASEVKPTTAPATEAKSAAKSETGSYTNHHESGKTYDGKGSKERSQTSAKRIEKETGDKHVATEHTPAKSERDAFKDESKRLDSHGGAKSDQNHNKIESPGKKKRIEDGEL